MPWRKLLDSISRRNGGGFRRLAAVAADEGDRDLLLLVADILESRLPIDASEITDTPKLMARLVYDSLRDPVFAGARNQQWVRRHALYAAGRYSVDLEIEHERGSARAALVGQVAHEQANLGQVPVLLMSGEDVVARAVSNRFGEFQFEYELAHQLKLFVPLAQRGTGIEVRLVGLR